MLMGLSLLGFVLQWVLPVLALLAVAVAGLHTAILRNLPSSLGVEPIDDEMIGPNQREIAEQIMELGFERIGKAITADMQPESRVVALQHEDGTYASVIQILGNQPKLAFDFVSVFQTPDVSLTSSREKDSGVLPAARGEFLQILPGLEPAELLAKHRAAIEYLEDHRLKTRIAAPADYLKLLTAAFRRKRELFLKRSVMHTLTALTRVVRKTTPYLGRIETQAAAQRQLADLGVPKGGGASRRMIKEPAKGPSDLSVLRVGDDD